MDRGLSRDIIFYIFDQEVDEAELALSQAENKCDNYAENYRKLKEEKEKLVEDMERQSKEQQQKIIDTRKGNGTNFCMLR